MDAQVDASQTEESLRQVALAATDPERFRPVLGEAYSQVVGGIELARRLLEDRVVWHISSTESGGGVAEMLHSLLAYARGVGVDVRWSVIEAPAEFFALTKRLHNNLHEAGEGGELDASHRRTYESALAPVVEELRSLVRPEDIVYLHDPQTAGLAPAISSCCGGVIWRCHIGVDRPGPRAAAARRFLEPYVRAAKVVVFSRRAFVWPGLDPARAWVVHPSVDVFSPKNQELEPEAVDAILFRTGLTDRDIEAAPAFLREDGSPGRVDRSATIDQLGPVGEDTPLIVQVSRWDRLKDHAGLLRCFAEHVRHPRAHLLLAGPEAGSVSDDPEGLGVLAEVRALWRSLPDDIRSRSHVACLPMVDGEENGAIVNAIQRRADVIVQKSLAEGFGLTVTEGMWKRRPVVASGVGGIQDQIVDGESGLLVDDPSDLQAFASAIDAVLEDAELAARIGEAGHKRVLGTFLGSRHLLDYVRLLTELLDGLPGAEEAGPDGPLLAADRAAGGDPGR